jgi:hypothetical protein
MQPRGGKYFDFGTAYALAARTYVLKATLLQQGKPKNEKTYLPLKPCHDQTIDERMLYLSG